MQSILIKNYGLNYELFEDQDKIKESLNEIKQKNSNLIDIVDIIE